MAFHGKKGDRVRLIFMPNDPNPIPENSTGTVEEVVNMTWGQDKRSQVWIDWDNGRRLCCICPPDHLEIIDEEARANERWFVNRYKCPTCEHEWTDVWSATCADMCPACHCKNVEPYVSEDTDRPADQ